jgi:hypothetical protein
LPYRKLSSAGVGASVELLPVKGVVVANDLRRSPWKRRSAFPKNLVGQQGSASLRKRQWQAESKGPGRNHGSDRLSLQACDPHFECEDGHEEAASWPQTTELVHMRRKAGAGRDLESNTYLLCPDSNNRISSFRFYLGI